MCIAFSKIALHRLERRGQYNDTRRWRCYEAALLMKKNEIRTDEESPPPVRDRVCVRKPDIEKSLFRKREKEKAFSFSYKKEIYPSLALVSILQ